MYNSILARFYAVPKIHKPVLALRPIVSSINAPNGKLEKFLTDTLTKAYDINNDFYVNDSFTFSEFINNFQLPANYILVSLDVVSLFTNLPLELARQSVSNHWEHIAPHSPIDIDSFLKILDFVFDSTYFVFNNSFYKQVYGTPMGSSISPIISNFVMDDLVQQSLPLLSFRPPFIKRYVDDLILAIPEDKVEETLFAFNLADQSLQFTVEREVDRSIPFLDMKLIRHLDNKIVAEWYSKPMSSGRYLNYYSDHPMKMKLGLVGAMASRVSRLTHPSLRNQALNRLKILMIENSYPPSVVHRLLFQNNNLNQSLIAIQNHFITQSVTNAQTSPTLTNNTIFRSLPFIRNLTPKLINVFKGLNIKFSTKINNSLRPLFTNLKTPVPLLQKFGLVYKIPCYDCHLSYIGQTSRSLNGRITSHKSDCRRNTQTCALATHCVTLDHRINFTDPEIIFTESNYYKRRFLEMVAIHNCPTTMNIKSDIKDLSSIYSYLLHLSSQ